MFSNSNGGRGNGELRCYHGENFTEVLVRANNVTNLPSCVAEIRSGRATSRLLPRVMKAVSQFIANQSLWVDKSKHSLETWHENSQPLYDLSCSPVTWKHPNSSMSLSWLSRSRRVEEIISDRMHQRPRDRGWPMGAQVSSERDDTGPAVRLGLTPGHYHIITHSDTRSHAPEPGVTGAGHTGLCYTNSPEAGQVSIMYPELRPEPWPRLPADKTHSDATLVTSQPQHLTCAPSRDSKQLTASWKYPT